ncbi:MAG: sigma-70 family RNA polymerase sigma factor, partial [Deltaproteobacteria bacterium]|nr:sigma-70 family RNA polymerase sigma factor [Deltaproteobacteria bacterium]
WSLVKVGTTQAERKLFQKLSRGKKPLNIVDAELTGENLKKVADLFGVKEEEVLSMEMRVASRDFSLDKVSTDDGTITYLDSISDYRANQEEIVESLQATELTQEGLQKGFEKLSPRERYVIERRYLTSPPMKLREVGDELEISKERVRQIETQALKKLRAVIESRLDHGPEYKHRREN